MLRFIFLISAMSFLLSCESDKQQRQSDVANIAIDTLEILNDPKNNLNIQTNHFSEIDSSGILMFPLSIPTNNDGGSFSSKSRGDNNYWNIIFLNGRTNEYHLLSERKMLISSYGYKYSDYDNVRMEQTDEHIFYTITIDDYNNDGKLTPDDPQYLFISDKTGYNFKQISPESCELMNWQFVKSINKVLMIVKKDSDNNKEFDDKDELLTFEVNMGTGAASKEIFSTAFKDKLKILFDKHWQQTAK